MKNVGGNQASDNLANPQVVQQPGVQPGANPLSALGKVNPLTTT